jgi:HSP20 family protein
MATSLVRWSPFRDLDLMERNMRRAFEGFGFLPSLFPAADVYETNDEYVVELEVPGYGEKELSIEVSDHTLTVKGERKELKEETERTFRLHERLEKQFERTFVLPPEAETTKVEAMFKQGVLEVHTPKAKTAIPKKVPITLAKTS